MRSFSRWRSLTNLCPITGSAFLVADFSTALDLFAMISPFLPVLE
jgi:hypothetical protein